jgi:hypothetical protein
VLRRARRGRWFRNGVVSFDRPGISIGDFKLRHRGCASGHQAHAAVTPTNASCPINRNGCPLPNLRRSPKAAIAQLAVQVVIKQGVVASVAAMLQGVAADAAWAVFSALLALLMARRGFKKKSLTKWGELLRPAAPFQAATNQRVQPTGHASPPPPQAPWRPPWWASSTCTAAWSTA